MKCNAWLGDRRCDFRTDDDDEMTQHEQEEGHEAEDLSPEWTI